LQLELKYKGYIEQGWMQVEREKIDKQSATKVHDTATRATTSMHDTLIKSKTAIDVAEIHEAGQLLNTNTEAAHDRRAAREMVENATRIELTN
jgi:hypothetical protein